MSVVNRRRFLLATVAVATVGAVLASQGPANALTNTDPVVIAVDKSLQKWAGAKIVANGGALTSGQTAVLTSARQGLAGKFKALVGKPWARGFMAAGAILAIAGYVAVMGVPNTGAPPAKLALGQVAPDTTLADMAAIVGACDASGGGVSYQGYGYATMLGGSPTSFPFIDPASGWEAYWVDTSNAFGRAEFVNGSLNRWFFVAKTLNPLPSSENSLLDAVRNLLRTGAGPTTTLTDTEVQQEVLAGVSQAEMARAVTDIIQEYIPDFTPDLVDGVDTVTDWGTKLAVPIPEDMPDALPETETETGGSSSSGGSSSVSSSSTSPDWTPPVSSPVPSVGDLPWPDPFDIGSAPPVVGTCAPPQVVINKAIPFSDQTIGTIEVGGWCDLITTYGPWLRSFVLALSGIGFVTSTILDD